MKRIHNKDDIIQAGLDIILRQGFNATGVEAILKHANVPKGSFYNFFASKEEFGLAIIDKFAGKMADIMQTILLDESLKPLERIKKSFERYIEVFENNSCSGGCLIGNLSLEMADNSEAFRLRLEKTLHLWALALSGVILEAQNQKAISADLDPEMLAENLVSSFQGALLRAKVKKSPEPLKNFIYLYFDKFLTQKVEVA